MIDGFALGPLYVRFYGIVLMLGTVAGGFLAASELKRRGRDPEMVWDLLVYLIIGGVIGARLWHVFTPSPSALVPDPATGQLVNPYFVGGTVRILDILSIWKGGLGIPGAVMGGLAALYFYVRKNGLVSFAEWTDIAAPGLALGQAIGRWGNFFNQELYGAPTSLPWKIYIDPSHRLAGFENESYYHPLFLYESILNLLNMLFLLWIARQYSGRLKKGDVFNVYLIIYPVIRFFLDFLRLDASRVFSININQTLMAVVAVSAALVLIWRHRSGTGEAAEVQVTDANNVEIAASKPQLESKRVVKKTVAKPAVKKPAAKKSVKKKTAK
ncbi:MAG: prolipoprotein diacylglyceryl transferase [Chloroflexi bacterium]|nr:prolipoprotein diacylglyceryl transferase [Chloroflexota bacterium]